MRNIPYGVDPYVDEMKIDFSVWDLDNYLFELL